jgi:hypothetical protein
VLPLIFAAGSVILIGFSLIVNGKIRMFADKYVPCLIVIGHLIYPLVTEYMFRGHSCLDLGDGELRLVEDLDLKCQSDYH